MALAGDTMHGREVRTLGDVQTDLRRIGSAASIGSSDSIGDFLSDTLSAFRRLPGELGTLEAQAGGVARVLSTAKIAGIGQDALSEAQGLLRDIRTQYPQVNVRVDALTRALAPIMPDLYAGTYGADVIGTLAANGLDLVGTVYAMNDLVGKKAQAEHLIQQAATNPALPPDVRNEAIASLGGANVGTVVKYGLMALVGYAVIRSVLR